MKELATCVARELNADGVRRPARPLKRHMRLAVEGAAGCEGEIGALAGRFGAVVADGRGR